MKKTLLSALALMLLCSLLLGTLAACKDQPHDDPEQSTQGETTAPEEEEKAPVRESILTGAYADLVENAKWLENGVNAYFTNSVRSA